MKTKGKIIDGKIYFTPIVVKSSMSSLQIDMKIFYTSINANWIHFEITYFQIFVKKIKTIETMCFYSTF